MSFNTFIRKKYFKTIFSFLCPYKPDSRKREEKESKGDLESGGNKGETTVLAFVGKIFIQSFTMTMLAEWGDRSQLATVILGLYSNQHKYPPMLKLT